MIKTITLREKQALTIVQRLTGEEFHLALMPPDEIDPAAVALPYINREPIGVNLVYPRRFTICMPKDAGPKLFQNARDPSAPLLIKAILAGTIRILGNGIDERIDITPGRIIPATLRMVGNAPHQEGSSRLFCLGVDFPQDIFWLSKGNVAGRNARGGGASSAAVRDFMEFVTAVLRPGGNL